MIKDASRKFSMRNDISRARRRLSLRLFTRLCGSLDATSIRQTVSRRITTANEPAWRLLLIGLIFHLVFIRTVFDCYFTDTVVHGMGQHSLPRAEAKRLVLIVADGLRADLLLAKNGSAAVPGAPEVVAPHLRSIIETRGAFGISHTRLPTESRPGHVALISGVYEDVSTITKGWQTVPLNVDSLFNQSGMTYAFGSQDILPMFALGATPGKVEIWHYGEHEQDYTKDATGLDTWVLENLRTLLHNATVDDVLNVRLRGEKTVFFLHLLGIDTTGHSYRPHSKEYMANIQVVDEIVKQTEELFSEFYVDDETAFVFTADHGMSRIGNHGDGDPDNTRTPLIAWGKGIRGPLPDTNPSSHDAYSESWGLSHLARRDVEQADVSVLMSTLIGVKWPANSVGVLPDVDPMKPGFLLPRDGERTVAEAALINAKVLLEHYRIKHEDQKAQSLFYKQYSHFAWTQDIEDMPGETEIDAIERLIVYGDYHKARLRATSLIEATLEGLHYLQTYDSRLIKCIVVAAHLGWMAFGAVFTLLPASPAASSTRSFPIHVAAAAVLVAFWAAFARQRSPRSYYLYITFPCYFWDRVLSRGSGPLLDLVRQGPKRSLVGHALRGGVVFAALLTIAGYTRRYIWSAWLVGMGVLWPLSSWPRELLSAHWKLSLAWAGSCLGTAVFPLLDVYREQDLVAIGTGGVAMFAIGVLGLFALKHPDPRDARRHRIVILWLLCALACSVVFALLIARNLSDKTPVPPTWRSIAWGTFLSSAVTPFVAPLPRSSPHGRVLALFLGVGACFVWLAIGPEGLFHVAYSLTLCLWVEVETVLGADTHSVTKVSSSSSSSNNGMQGGSGRSSSGAYRPRLRDLRIALFWLIFVQLGFFGNGK
ncbi:PigN-domain-containing protein [Trametes sanguinea]|nr:PigN-domain-containing protein [Trametes sanguinea]